MQSGKVAAQSRNRCVFPDDDNHGFAAWVHDNEKALFETLGPGHHFGEWYGQGINRGYGLKEKRFALFNTHRWSEVEEEFTIPGLDVVPILRLVYDFSTPSIFDSIEWLKGQGSSIAPGFMKPEGIVIFHHPTSQLFKVPFDKDLNG